MFEVAHHGVAAAQLGGPAVPLVVVADGAVADHGQDEGEDPLVVTRGAWGMKGMRRPSRFTPLTHDALLDMQMQTFCSKILDSCTNIPQDILFSVNHASACLLTSKQEMLLSN